MTDFLLNRVDELNHRRRERSEIRDFLNEAPAEGPPLALSPDEVQRAMGDIQREGDYFRGEMARMRGECDDGFDEDAPEPSVFAPFTMDYFKRRGGRTDVRGGSSVSKGTDQRQKDV